MSRLKTPKKPKKAKPAKSLYREPAKRMSRKERKLKEKRRIIKRGWKRKGREQNNEEF